RLEGGETVAGGGAEGVVDVADLFAQHDADTVAAADLGADIELDAEFLVLHVGAVIVGGGDDRNLTANQKFSRFAGQHREVRLRQHPRHRVIADGVHQTGQGIGVEFNKTEGAGRRTDG